MTDILDTLNGAWNEEHKANLMHYCDLAAQEIRRLRALPAQEWQDISTAPKDGEPIIYQDPDQAVSTCSWQEDDCGSSWWDIAGDKLAYPVRWMPLPPVAVIADHRTEEA